MTLDPKATTAPVEPEIVSPEMTKPEIVRRCGTGGAIRLGPVMKGEGWPARGEPTMREQLPPDDLDTHPERYMLEASVEERAAEFARYTTKPARTPEHEFRRYGFKPIASGGLLAGIYFRPKRNLYNGGWTY